MKAIAAVPALVLSGILASSIAGVRGGAQTPGPNPVKPTPEGLAKAKKVYGYDCAVCHGTSGDGKGDIASSLKTPMKDFSDPSVQSQSDAELFTIIQKGKGEMPSEGDRGKPEDIWNMVNYVRSFAKK
jgi:mono/diheme cytochrome c family protein